MYAHSLGSNGERTNILFPVRFIYSVGVQAFLLAIKGEQKIHVVETHVYRQYLLHYLRKYCTRAFHLSNGVNVNL
jgi:hypothetical protein